MNSPIELLNGRISLDPVDLLGYSRAMDTDVVMISGTLLEGIGNPYSDLDMYVIGEQLPSVAPTGPVTLVIREDGRVRRVNEALPHAGGIILDVQYYTLHELSTLSRSLNELYAESRQSARIFRKTLHPDDEDLIHKLLTGTVLRDDARVFDAHKIFDRGRFCFLKYRNEVGGYAEFRDLMGSWNDGDLDSCLFNMRNYLVSQVSGMLFLAGSTNPRPKWFLRRLASFGEPYTGLRRGLLSWLHGARGTDAQKREAIETACHLIDSTWTHIRSLLGTAPTYFHPEEALALADRELAARGSGDREADEEFELLQRIFSANAAPLASQMNGQPHWRQPHALLKRALG